MLPLSQDLPLEPTPFSLSLPSGAKATVRKISPVFSPWSGDPIEDDYGGKPVLDIAGKPLFAELAILRSLKSVGWEGGCWVDSYRNRRLTGLPHNESSPVDLPPDRERLLSQIRERNGGWSGCWDVFVWREDRVLFAEAKRAGEDDIRTSQLEWLESALRLGLDPESFVVVEWRLED